MPTFFAAHDLDGNGVFDDGRRGSNINIDTDGDGKIGRMEEVFRSLQIIKSCADSFLIAVLSPDGSFVKLVRTEVQIPRIGEPAPEFALETTNGKTITSGELRGKTYLLDFWASWCRPCVAKFPRLQELEREWEGRVKVIAVNVDNEKKAASAERIIGEYELNWAHVMSKSGDDDPLWKMFGSMEGLLMAVPLYVLVDSRGYVRYASHGGTDLKELATNIDSVIGK